MMKKCRIGLVFEGGGGKGAYQIGVWKAMRELGLESSVTAVSGTSVGALNGALFLKGSLSAAEAIWNEIELDTILQTKHWDYFENGDCLFSQKNLESLIEGALRNRTRNANCQFCYAACRYVNKGEVRYFDIASIVDPEYQKKILLASSALPIIYESVILNGEEFMDGGAGGDNLPITPLLSLNLDKIILVRLSDKKIDFDEYKNAGISLIEIAPSYSLGNFVTGTLEFDRQKIAERMENGYQDGIRELSYFAETLMEYPRHKKEAK